MELSQAQQSEASPYSSLVSNGICSRVCSSWLISCFAWEVPL